MRGSYPIWLICWLFILLSSCGTFIHQPSETTPARLGEDTRETIALKSLPDPKDQIIVAVYKFRDQTGQYKPSENGASWSTAVTQGATSILLKALQDSGWFVPIERENVSNLLNERKIIRSSRVQYGTVDGNDQLLPALLYAGVILEGGIVSYDANVVTGGAGLRYFAAGGSSQYRQDRVTVYLRAISTSNGKILKTVYTSKTILSQAVDAGIFRFVRFGRLLEAETGFTFNEPSEIAVTEAIEKAVLSLIIEGIEEGLWELKEKRQIVAQTILDYKKERELIPQTDIFGRRLNNRRKQFYAFGGTSSVLYKGDFPDPLLRTGGEIGIGFNQHPFIGWKLGMGLSQFATSGFYKSDISYLDLSLQYRLFPYNVFTPYTSIGGGFIAQNASSRFDFSGKVYSKASMGGGVEYLLKNNTGLWLGADYHLLFSDGIDAVEQGKYNDFYWKINAGVNIYFGYDVKGERKFDYKKNK